VDTPDPPIGLIPEKKDPWANIMVATVMGCGISPNRCSRPRTERRIRHLLFRVLARLTSPPPTLILLTPWQYETSSTDCKVNKSIQWCLTPTICTRQEDSQIGSLTFILEEQEVDGVELDRLFTDLRSVLQKHPLLPEENLDDLVSEWINDLLFLTGKITEEELQEATQASENMDTSQH